MERGPQPIDAFHSDAPAAVLLIALAVTLAACGGGGTPAAPPAPTVAAAAGAYALAQFNGAAVPYTTYDRPQYRVEVIGGTLTVRDGGTYHLVIDRRLTDGAGTRTYPNADSGAVSRRGDTLTFTPGPTRPAFPGVLAGGAITVTGGIGSRTGMSDQLTGRR